MRFSLAFTLSLCALAAAAPITSSTATGADVANAITTVTKQSTVLDGVLARLGTTGPTAAKFNDVDEAGDTLTDKIKAATKTVKASAKLTPAEVPAVVTAVNAVAASIKKNAATIVSKKAAFVQAKATAHIKEALQSDQKALDRLTKALLEKTGPAPQISTAATAISADLTKALAAY
jgi:hypothetical protein